MYQEKEEQVVFVKDLLFSALYQWRRILAVAVIFAVILGGFSAFIQAKSIDPEKNAILLSEYEAAKEEYDSQVKDHEEQKSSIEEHLANTETLIAQQETYLDESLLMSIDPYNAHTASMTLTVLTKDLETDSDNADIYQISLINAYCAALRNSEFIHATAGTIGATDKYLLEMLNFTVNNSTLQIQIYCPTHEHATVLLDAFIERLSVAEKQLKKDFVNHTLYIADKGVHQKLETTLIDLQYNATQRLQNLLTNKTTGETLLDNLELTAATLVAPEAPAIKTAVSVKTVVLFAVGGAVLGALIVCGFAFLRHIRNKKVYSARMLTNKTSLKVLGCLGVDDTKNPIDRWLKKQEGRVVGTDTLALTAATVRNYCIDRNVLILGDCGIEAQQMIADTLRQENISVTIGGDLLSDVQAPAKLSACDTVLLVEKCGCSRYRNILLTIEQVADNGKNLIGCILLEG